MHRAECEEGMPPESAMALTSHIPVFHRLVNICKGRTEKCLCEGHMRGCKSLRDTAQAYLERLCKEPSPETNKEAVIGGQVSPLRCCCCRRYGKQ